MISNIQDKTVLSNGVEMPWFGLGVFQVDEGGEIEQAVKWALDLGYRSVDTAAVYGNEAGVGKAIRDSGVRRADVFLTTKVWNADQGYDGTLRAFEESLKKLSTDYMDLYLIHWPVKGKFKDTWRALEEVYRDGRARAIGVSNFHVHHLRSLLDEGGIVPMVNQVEFHPYLCQPELMEFCAAHRIQLEAWSPLMQGRVFAVPELIELAKKYAKTPAQLVLRWDLQHGVVTIPKSVHKDRIETNADIFDFEISDEDMVRLNALDRGHRLGPDPDHFNF